MWKDYEISKLIELFPDETNKNLSVILNKSVSAIINKSTRLGLKKSKKHKSILISKRNKSIGRDLTIDNLKNIALCYKTRSEFQLNDPSAYSTSCKMGILDDVCSHMIKQSYTMPQLICKSIFDTICESNGLYNDRKTIRPYEIDIYYPEYKLAIEYNGGKWHNNDDNTELKKKICEEREIELIIIVENNRNYESDIKSQIINNLEIINLVLNKKITVDYINNIRVDNSIFNDIIDYDYIKSIVGKYDNYSDFRVNETSIYNKLIRLGKLDEFTYKLKRSRTIWNIDKLNDTISKYTKLCDFIKNDYGCYLHIKKNKLEHMICHLERCRTQKF